jgi:hypothetical protein
MVYRWRCRWCPRTLWAADGDALAEAIKSHLLEHAASNLRRDEVRTVWHCPHCGTQTHTMGDGAVESFKSHLFDHAVSRIETGVHVADDVDGSGSVLVVGPADTPSVENARAHFLARADAAIVVTADPAARLRLLDRTLPSWPASTTVVTTVSDPLASVPDVDPSAHSVDVVRLAGRPDLSSVGETLAETLEAHRAVDCLSVAFDILPEIVAKFELQSVFRFLHLLSSRLDRTGALSHYYLDPRRTQRASRNVLEQVFDLSITADGEVFRSETPSG